MPRDKMLYLVTPRISAQEDADIEMIAAHFGINREEAVRKAVSFFASQCVPTQKTKIKQS